MFKLTAALFAAANVANAYLFVEEAILAQVRVQEEGEDLNALEAMVDASKVVIDDNKEKLSDLKGALVTLQDNDNTL